MFTVDIVGAENDPVSAWASLGLDVGGFVLARRGEIGECPNCKGKSNDVVSLHVDDTVLSWCHCGAIFLSENGKVRILHVIDAVRENLYTDPCGNVWDDEPNAMLDDLLQD